MSHRFVKMRKQAQEDTYKSSIKNLSLGWITDCWKETMEEVGKSEQSRNYLIFKMYHSIPVNLVSCADKTSAFDNQSMHTLESRVTKQHCGCDCTGNTILKKYIVIALFGLLMPYGCLSSSTELCIKDSNCRPWWKCEKEYIGCTLTRYQLTLNYINSYIPGMFVYFFWSFSCKYHSFQ